MEVSERGFYYLYNIKSLQGKLIQWNKPVIKAKPLIFSVVFLTLVSMGQRHGNVITIMRYFQIKRTSKECRMSVWVLGYHLLVESPSLAFTWLVTARV